MSAPLAHEPARGPELSEGAARGTGGPVEQTNSVLLYVPGVVGWCAALLLLIYNSVALFLFLHEREDRGPSRTSLLAWATGVAAVLSWCAPCLGGLLAVAALVLARRERIRIYRDEAPLAGATPVRMASLDGAAALVLHAALWTIGVGRLFLSGAG